jgi:hypothetical protein
MQQRPSSRAASWMLAVLTAASAALIARILGPSLVPAPAENAPSPAASAGEAPVVERSLLVDAISGAVARVSLVVQVEGRYRLVDRVVLAAFDDGTVVWSGDPDRVGRPLLRTAMSAESVAELARDLGAVMREVPREVRTSEELVPRARLSIDGDDEYLFCESSTEVAPRPAVKGRHDLALITAEERANQPPVPDGAARARKAAAWAAARARIERFLPEQGEGFVGTSLCFELREPRSSAPATAGVARE